MLHVHGRVCCRWCVSGLLRALPVATDYKVLWLLSFNLPECPSLGEDSGIECVSVTLMRVLEGYLSMWCDYARKYMPYVIIN